MSNFLNIPVCVYSLRLEADLAAVGPTARFEKLPFSDGSDDFNVTTPNISESVVTHPFDNKFFTLSAGVHLHWSLPQFLKGTRDGRIVEKSALLSAPGNDETLWTALHNEGLIKPIDENHASVLSSPTGGSTAAERLKAYLAAPLANDLPRVPNRWLVTRKSCGARRRWLVESDYLHPPGTSTTAAVSIPFPPDDDGGGRPYRFLGRRFPLSAWPGEENAADRITPLTAIGYGTHTFESLYPNCHSVFGFFDPEPATSHMPDLTYSVIGWYADPAEDALSLLIGDLRNRHQQHRGEDTTWLIEQLREEAGLSINQKEKIPDRSLCFGRAVPRVKAEAAKMDETVQKLGVAIGQTGTEALSASIAASLDADKDRRKLIEDQIEAIQLSGDLENRRLDIGPKFAEARHLRGFGAIEAGTVWVIRPQATGDAPADASGASEGELALNPSLAKQLADVNVAQAAFDRAQAEIASYRQLTFLDWVKYMVAAYPPIDSHDSFPSMDEIRSFIEIRDVAALDARVKWAGSVRFVPDRGEVSCVECHGADGSLARRLANSVEALLADIERHNKRSSGKRALSLFRSAAPRFWQPNEPVVLLTGEAARPSLRNDPGPVICAVHEMDTPELITPAGVTFFADALERLVERGPPAPISDDWHPLMLEWEVEIAAVSSHSNHSDRRVDYDPAFITDNFTLRDADCKLTAKGNEDLLSASIYKGQSLLTGQAKTALLGRLEGFLRNTIVSAFNADPHAKDRIPAGEAMTAEQIFALRDWYKATRLGDAETSDQTPDPIWTALRSLELLQNNNVLTQTLSGFNDALLMQRQTFQLNPSDPLGFEDDRRFTEQLVKPAVGRFNRTAPLPYNFFNPLRTGAMRVLALRLVDSFGRVSRNLATAGTGGVSTTAEMTSASDRYPILLKPAYVQPARLNFRFLSTGSHDVESNSHPDTGPVAGWVLPNFLDSRLMIHDAVGRALGSVAAFEALEGEGARWDPATSDTGLVDPEQIGNRTLRRIVRRLVGYGADGVGRIIEATERALDAIDPESFARHGSLPLLVGRPLAVVRSRLSLETLGLNAVDHGWASLMRDLQGHGRRDSGFPAVRIPIRLGEPHQLNDGLVGYWVESPQGRAVFHAPKDRQPGATVIRTAVDGPVFLEQALSDPPVEVTMLMDPRGSVHATAGVLPVKEIALPQEHYADALSRIRVSFRAAPVMTSGADLRLPLPLTPGMEWYWIERDVDGWTPPFALKPGTSDADLTGRRQLRDGWLELRPGAGQDETGGRT